MRASSRLCRASSTCASSASRYFFCGRAVGRDEIARALVADARHALDVVDRIARERQHVHHPVRRDAEALDDGGRVVPEAFVARVEDAHGAPARLRPGLFAVHQLQQVLVAGDDDHVVRGRGRARGNRADHVVGLEARGGDDGHAHRFARGVHPRDLLRQVGRHRRAVRLVVGGERRSERRAGEVERRGNERRVLIVDELAQHRHETVDGVGRAAVGAGQFPDRVIRAIHLGAAVDEEERRFTGGHRRKSVYHLASCRFPVLIPHPIERRG
jgi:hypothetical protein